MKLDRRSFLQQIGMTFLTWGGMSFIPNLGKFNQPINRYIQTLAEPTNRKLALLVGINQYSNSNNLNGCITDVERQFELLVHRFGFNPQDIVSLTGKQATRENIENTFIEHLSSQAKEGDVVVFHFSGYGSKMKVKNYKNELEYGLANSLVPTDEVLQGKFSNHILEETLLLLGKSLATEKVTMVLDTSYNNFEIDRIGNLRIRSQNKYPQEAAQEELEYYIELKQRLENQNNKSPGTIIKAAGDNQIATEAFGNGFYAGLFTYNLTKYLWGTTPANTVLVSLRKTASEVESIMGKLQQPTVNQSELSSLLTYYQMADNSLPGEGIIIGKEENGNILIKLTGMSSQTLKNYGLNSCFAYAEEGDINVNEIPLLSIRSKDGLIAKAQPLGQINYQEGEVLQEVIRVIPGNVGLTVALENQLQRIERVDATSAFSNIYGVESVVNSGEQAADCLLAKAKLKVNLEGSFNTQQDLITPYIENEKEIGALAGGYGLFSIGGIPIPNTIGQSSEAVKSAVFRLKPQLNILMAAKLLRLTVNEASSRLPVKVTLEITNGENQSFIKRESVRQLKSTSLDDSFGLSPDEGLVPSIRIGSQIKYKVENCSNRPIYGIIIGINSDSNLIAIYTQQLKNKPIQEGKIVDLPETSNFFNWTILGPVGLSEIKIICSDSPFSRTYETIDTIENYNGEEQKFLYLSNPVDVSKAILSDLHNASNIPENIVSNNNDGYALDVNHWATFNFIYKVI